MEILDALIKMECYVDCTIYVDDHKQFKAHRVVLAANSPYFQSILQDQPMDHCSILFPGVKAFEMQALLEYMYTGEVNVTQSQIPRIMKIAEQLEVKGLFDMTDLKDKFNKMDEQHHQMSSRSGSSSAAASAAASSSTNGSGHYSHHMPHQSSPITSSTTSAHIASAVAQSSTSQSPPYNFKQSPYSSLYPNSSENQRNSQSNSERPPSTTPAWPQLPNPLSANSPHLQSAAAAAMLSSVYESGADMNPLKRKKLSSISSMLMNRDTPILRNVLAQTNAADSSQPHHSSMNTSSGSVERAGSDRQSSQSNGSAEYSMKVSSRFVFICCYQQSKLITNYYFIVLSNQAKYEEPQSPFTDKSFDDDSMMDTSANSQNYGGVDPRIAGYVPQQHQKPEWKRYKQYTRNDILSAIECVRNGMSALQASRKFGVPSRTLYDKVKKMGITTGRPMNRSVKRSPSNGSPAGFPFGLSGMTSPYGNHPHNDQQPHSAELERDSISGGPPHLPPTIPHPAAALLDATFLQQALEARGGDIAGRDALHAMAFAAAAHAAVNGMSTSPGNHGTARSPSPSILMKYMRRPNNEDAVGAERESNNNTKNKHNGDEEREEETGSVEDLSMTKKSSSSSSSAEEKPATTKEGPASENAEEESDKPLAPHGIPAALMMMFKRDLSPHSQEAHATSLVSSSPGGVIVQASTKQVSPIAAIKEEIRDERMREVAIDEPTHD